MSASIHAEIDLELRVASKQEVADGVVMIELTSFDGTELPVWTPGSHIDLVLGNDLERQYSLCGDPADRTTWRVAVLRERNSRGGSEFVHDGLKIGAKQQVRGPRNHFELAPSPAYLFVAGGIGITPILPMIAAAKSAGADWRLMYGGRSRASMAFAAELVERDPDRVEVVPQDEAGLLPLEAIAGTPQADTLVYCCGPEPLLTAVETVCSAWPVGSLHVERFAPRKVDAFDPDSPFVVELSLSDIEFTVNPGETILEALVDNGIEVDTSCTEGVCGTCETRVLEGIPDHLDSVLSPEERAANDTMFVCVSRSRCPRLVLEL